MLGRDAEQARLDHWLTVAAPVDGFAGFAIGRSIWEQPLIDHLAGRVTADEATATIAANYRHYAGVYEAARR